jgi:hypothetical protein
MNWTGIDTFDTLDLAIGLVCTAREGREIAARF